MCKLYVGQSHARPEDLNAAVRCQPRTLLRGLRRLYPFLILIFPPSLLPPPRQSVHPRAAAVYARYRYVFRRGRLRRLPSPPAPPVPRIWTADTRQTEHTRRNQDKESEKYHVAIRRQEVSEENVVLS